MTRPEKSVNETLIDYIETSSTALDILARAGFTGNRRKAVADVLYNGTLQAPPDFPSNRACIAYGKAIAEHILTKEKETGLCD